MRTALCTRACAAQALDGVLHGERIHHGGQHAHVIAGHAVESRLRQARAAEDVAATDHAGHLHAGLLDLEHFARDALDHRGIDAEVGPAEQRLARELDQDAFVAVAAIASNSPARAATRTLP